MRRKIEHPDQFIEGKRYSTLVQHGSEFKRVSGKFSKMASQPFSKSLRIILASKQEGFYTIPWSNSYDWVEI